MFQAARSKDDGCFCRLVLFMDNVIMVAGKAKKVMGIIFYFSPQLFKKINFKVHVDYSKHPSLKGVSPFPSEETLLVVGS